MVTMSILDTLLAKETALDMRVHLSQQVCSGREILDRSDSSS